MMHAPEDQGCWGVKWRAGTSNFRTVDELFTKRNLWAIAAALDGIRSIDIREIADALSFCATGIMLGLSRMNRYMPEATFPFYLLTGTYYTPQVSCEEPFWKHYENKFTRVVKGYEEIKNNLAHRICLISTEDARHLGSIAGQSIDYIFTDPSYGDRVQYGELNFIWEAWLRLDTHWHKDEIIVNEVRGITETDWADGMREAMSECHRVLKPGRWLSLCYHDTSEGTWSLVQDIMAEVGFITDKSDCALFIDTQQKSFNQLTADKVTKRDLVINFRKPKPSEVGISTMITGDEDNTSFAEKVRLIIREFLEAHPGSAKDRVYDEVVSRMVRAGQMEPHNFEELLRQVAEEVREPVKKNLFENQPPNFFGTHETGRWYLKETEVNLQDAAESAKEDAAAATIQVFMSKWLKQHPESEGVHYSDLFEHYVYSIKDKPRRLLAEWLPDYFYKTIDGTWRLPNTDEELKTKTEGRAKGTNRHIRRYVTALEQGLDLPDKERPNDTTLAEWVRHCKRSGMYEQGKLLYERGGLNLDHLSEAVQANVEEDYQVCVRMMGK